jgi:mono/diheme cytochrome c family protein
VHLQGGVCLTKGELERIQVRTHPNNHTEESAIRDFFILWFSPKSEICGGTKTPCLRRRGSTGPVQEIERSLSLVPTKHKTLALAMMGLALFGSLSLTAAFAGQGKKKPPVKPDPKAAIAAGKKVYNANMCGGCHKIGGNGGETGPTLDSTGADPKHTAKWFAEQIKNPKSHKEDSTMPPYADKIKGKDLDNLVAYMTSLKGDKK